MNYEKMILEMFERIARLEEKVTKLEKSNSNNLTQESPQEKYKTSKKYRLLSEYLKESNEDVVSLIFSEIEEILQFKLADSAKIHKEFWANSTSHSIALSWLSAGYRTVEVNLDTEFVVFEKTIKNQNSLYQSNTESNEFVKSNLYRKILFCNLAYLPNYNTSLDKIAPKGGGEYVEKNKDAFEKHNYEECEDGLYRGFVETKHHMGYKVGFETNSYNSLHIEKIDPSAKNKGCVQHVLVVFCAKSPQKDKTVIVGWYDNATVFRRRPVYNGREFNLRANIADSYLLPEEERTFEVPRANANEDKIGFGQSNLWYAETAKSRRFVEDVIDYIESYKK